MDMNSDVVIFSFLKNRHKKLLKFPPKLKLKVFNNPKIRLSALLFVPLTRAPHLTQWLRRPPIDDCSYRQHGRCGRWYWVEVA
jgi:hypothetical protein